MLPNKTISELDFGPAGSVDASLSERARGLVGSEILKIAGEIRAMVAASRKRRASLEDCMMRHRLSITTRRFS